MVSKVGLLTSAVAVCSFMVVVYMAVVPSYRYRSVWNIENKHVYNVHLMDFVQRSREVEQGEAGRKAIATGTESTQMRAEMSHGKERQDFEPVNPGSNEDGIPFQAATDDWKQRVKTAEFEGDLLLETTEAPHVQIERIPDIAASKKPGVQIPSIFAAMSGFRSTTVNRTAATTDAWPKCSNLMCSEYLSPADKAAFQLCVNKVKAKLKHVMPLNGSCHFMDGSHRQPVALVSLPGSGNTWVRGLLETATKICTGFVFCDISLRVQGFIGENIQSGSVLAVKTHGSVPLWTGSSKKKTHFGSAIFIVRNPLDAHIAEWNRKVANNFRGMTVTLQSHVKRAGEEWFGQNKRWQNFVRDQTRRWQIMIKNWIINNRHHPVLVVMYEDLKQNALREVLRMLDFLKVPHSMDIVKQRLAAGFDSFQRGHHKDDFDHYTPEQRDFVREAVISTSKLVEDNHLAHILQLQNYV